MTQPPIPDLKMTDTEYAALSAKGYLSKRLTPYLPILLVEWRTHTAP
jgi:hypothetical protein